MMQRVEVDQLTIEPEVRIVFLFNPIAVIANRPLELLIEQRNDVFHILQRLLHAREKLRAEERFPALALDRRFFFILGNVRVLDDIQALEISPHPLRIFREIIELRMEGFFEIDHRQLEVAVETCGIELGFSCCRFEIARNHIERRREVFRFFLPLTIAREVGSQIDAQLDARKVILAPTCLLVEFPELLFALLDFLVRAFAQNVFALFDPDVFLFGDVLQLMLQLRQLIRGNRLMLCHFSFVIFLQARQGLNAHEVLHHLLMVGNFLRARF